MKQYILELLYICSVYPALKVALRIDGRSSLFTVQGKIHNNV